jgi:hypothetical protein
MAEVARKLRPWESRANQDAAFRLLEQIDKPSEERRKHLTAVGQPLIRWLRDLDTSPPALPYDAPFDVEKDGLFPALIQHCPDVSRQYDQLERLRLEYSQAQAAIAREMTQEVPPEGNSDFAKEAARVCIFLGLGGSPPPHVSSLGINQEGIVLNITLNGRITAVAVARDDNPRRLFDLHGQVVERHLHSPSTEKAVALAKQMPRLFTKLRFGIDRTLREQSYLHRCCSYCPP